MNPDKLIQPGNVLCDASVRSKKHCLEILSELLAHGRRAMPHDEIFAKLIERERIGATGMGNGVAFPHCRLAGIESSHGALIKLSEAIEFDTPDAVPVDLVFGLMVPEELSDEHREEIVQISALLSEPDVRARLREASSNDELYSAFITLKKTQDEQPRPRSALRGN